MRRIILLFLFTLTLMTCGGTTENNITEVGNAVTETKNAATASATTQALTQGTSGLMETVESSLLTAALMTGQSHVTIQTENFNCEFSLIFKTLTCECPEGGSFTRTFDASLSLSEGALALDNSFETEFDDCQIETCGEVVTLAGNTSGTTTGNYNLDVSSGDVTANSATASSCSGMVSDDTDYGFDMTLSYDVGDVEFTGSYCFDGDSITFTSLSNLRDQVDPDDACDDFGP